MNVPYWKQTVQLVQGDLLFMYTRGLTDTVDAKGEAFSEARMVASLNEIIHKTYDITDFGKAMEEAVFDFMDGAEQEKDIATLLFRYYWG